MKRLHLIFILLLLIGFSTAQVQINEVMYSPYDGNEWVELYNPSNQKINLSSWIFTGENSVDEITCCEENCSLLVGAQEYLIILDQDSTLDKSDFNYVCVDDDSLGNGLNDQGETIIISNGTYQDSVFYVKENGAYKNNKTLEKRKDGTFGESIVFFGTPGKENSIWKFSTDYFNLEITEFLPNPFNKDDLEKPFGEWVEIYNGGDAEIDINGLILTKGDYDDELYIADNKVLDETILCPGCYKVIYRDGDSDFSLSNYGYGEIKLYESNILIDSVSYSDSTEGMSWARVDENWYQTEPTPGEGNYYREDCDWELNILTQNSIFQKEDFQFSLKVNRHFGFTQNITLRGKIENHHGEIIKEYFPWTNHRVTTFGTKTYSPNLAEGIYQLDFWIENLSCEDWNLINNRITKLIAINPEYKEFTNNLEINKLYLGSDDKAQWADQFTAKIKIYKGNETKTAIESWVEKEGKVVSKRSKLNAYDQYQTYILTIPIQLHPNCANEDGRDGTAKLILEGLGLRAETDFLIEGIDPEVCKEYVSYIKEKERLEIKEKRKNSYQILDLPDEIYSGQIIRVKIQQWDNKEHDFKAWSYLYRGNKCYSCSNGESEREDNLIRFSTKENELKKVNLLVKLDENLDEGEYNLVVNLLKDNRRTPIKIREKIHVKEKENLSNISLKVLNEDLVSFSRKEEKGRNKTPSINKRKQLLNDQNGVVVYESNSEKSKKLIPYLLITILAMLSIILILKK